jgi:proteasome component ECM29
MVYRQEKTLSSSVSALLDSLNVTKLSSTDLSARLTNVLPLVIKANSTHAKTIHLQTFKSLKSMFDRVPAVTDLSNGDIKTSLETLLFDASFEGLPEAMRTKRAETLVAIAKVNGCKWVVEKVKPEVDGGERSSVVRGTLAKVGKGQ